LTYYTGEAVTKADNKDIGETWPQEGVSLENDPLLLL
jgi:hypothetical protein